MTSSAGSGGWSTASNRKREHCYSSLPLVLHVSRLEASRLSRYDGDHTA